MSMGKEGYKENCDWISKTFFRLTSLWARIHTTLNKKDTML